MSWYEVGGKGRSFSGQWSWAHILSDFGQVIPPDRHIGHDDSTQLFGLFWKYNPIRFAKMSDIYFVPNDEW